jgi:hypothetical protein
MLAAVPTVSIADASADEGNFGSRTMSFVVSLSAAAQQTTSVRYQTLDGTATVAGSDYGRASGTITFRPGQRTANVPVSIRGDRVPEANETFQVVLSSATGATLGRASATGTIFDDDTVARRVTVTGPQAGVNEGVAATFTFSLSGAATAPVTVSYATSDLTASSASDYAAATGSLTFAVGETSKQISVTTRTDSVVESDETLQMRILSATGATVGTRTAIATIKDVPPVTPPTPSGGSWTILVYMTGEDLNTYARDDVNEMEKALGSLPGSVKIVVSWDQPKASVGTAYATGGGTQPAWRTYGRSVLKADASTTKIASTFNLSFGEKNTGDPATLVDFVKWGVQQAPAQHYLLQMWGHGGGTDGSQFDSESGDDALTIGEMASALGAPGMPTIDLVSYDNCLMAMAELGVAIAPKVTGVFVASEELINGTGQDYTTAYSALKVADPASVTASQIAAGMVASYQTQYQGDSGKCDTFSTATASGYTTLATAIKQFVDATATLTTANRTTLVSTANASVTYDTTPFRDLGSFMTKVAAATSLPQTLRTAATAVTAAIGSVIVGKTADQRSSSGVSVYLPTTSSDAYLATYATDAAAFCQATGWNTFAKWLATGTRSVSTAADTLVRSTPTRPDLRSGGNAPAANAAWAAFAAFSGGTDTDVAKTRRRGTV